MASDGWSPGRSPDVLEAWTVLPWLQMAGALAGALIYWKPGQFYLGFRWTELWQEL